MPLDPISGLFIIILDLFSLALSLVFWAVIISVVASWLVFFNVINTRNQFVSNLLYAIDRVTEPMYRRLRKIIPTFGNLDIAPMIVILAVIFAQGSLIPYLKGVVVYIASH